MGFIFKYVTIYAYQEEASFNSSIDDDDDDGDRPSTIKTSSVVPPVQLSLRTEDIRLIKTFRSKLQRLGVGIRLSGDGNHGDQGVGGCEYVEITHLPACMVEREAHELRRGRQPVALSMVEVCTCQSRSFLQSMCFTKDGEK